METFPSENLKKSELEVATLENIAEAFNEWGHNAADDDPYLQAMGPALCFLINEFPPFSGSIETMLEWRHDPEHVQNRGVELSRLGPRNFLTKQYAANLIRCSLTNALLNDAGEYRFPDDFKRPEAYVETIIAKYTDAFKLSSDSRERSFEWVDKFENNLIHRFVQTNVPERYKGVMLAKYKLGNDFPSVIRNVDFGCSLVEGWTQLGLNVPFKQLNIMKKDERTGLLIPDPETSSTINPFINQPLEIQYSIGVDLMDPRNEDNASWVWSCRRPNELVNREMINRDYQLTSANLDNIGYVRADYSVSDDMAKVMGKIRELNGSYEPPNLVTCITSAYEDSDEAVTAMISNAAELMPDEDSILLLQEPVEIDENAPNGLRFSDDFRQKGIYKLIVGRPHQPELGWEVLAVYSNGRCEEAIL